MCCVWISECILSFLGFWKFHIDPVSDVNELREQLLESCPDIYISVCVFIKLCHIYFVILPASKQSQSLQVEAGGSFISSGVHGSAMMVMGKIHSLSCTNGNLCCISLSMHSLFISLAGPWIFHGHPYWWTLFLKKTPMFVKMDFTDIFNSG